MCLLVGWVRVLTPIQAQLGKAEGNRNGQAVGAGRTTEENLSESGEKLLSSSAKTSLWVAGGPQATTVPPRSSQRLKNTRHETPNPGKLWCFPWR